MINKTYRNQAYLNWVKTLPCCVTGLPADDAHHLKGHGMGSTVKAPDWAAIPLIRELHNELHSSGWQTWEAAYGNQMEFVAITLGKAIESGILK